MAFALEHGEPVAAGLRRITDELLAEAVAELRGAADPATAVHTARKASKRVRAVARVARPVLRAKTYRQANGTAREAAGVLATTRDAHVLATTFEQLMATANDPHTYDALGAALQTGVEPVDTASLEQAAALLDELRAQTAAWELRDGGWAALGPGLERVYRRGRTALQRAAGKPSAERLHDWRKSVKYLWHGVELLAPAWPPVLEPVADQAHRLAQHLGDDHDLAVLEQHLEALPETPTPPGLAELAAARHAELRATAFSLGLRLYAEKPSAFAERMRAYYDAWSAS